MEKLDKKQASFDGRLSVSTTSSVKPLLQKINSPEINQLWCEARDEGNQKLMEIIEESTFLKLEILTEQWRQEQLDKLN